MGEMVVLNPMEVIERVVTAGDLAKMTPDDRVSYYARVCESVGLNPMTKPFEYIQLNGKLVLYAKRDAADQLRSLHKVAIRIVSQEAKDGLYVVTVDARTGDGRSDTDVGAVPFGNNLQGEARANAIMKAVTKAKRRVTLSICGLGCLDETEVASIPGAQKWQEPDPDWQEKLPELLPQNMPQTPPQKPKRMLPLMGPNGEVLAEYPDASEWVAGLAILAKDDENLISENWAFLTKVATNKNAPADVKAKAEALRQQVDGDTQDAA